MVRFEFGGKGEVTEVAEGFKGDEEIYRDKPDHYAANATVQLPF